MPSTLTDRARSLAKFDASPDHRPPRLILVAAAVIVSIVQHGTINEREFIRSESR